MNKRFKQTSDTIIEICVRALRGGGMSVEEGNLHLKTVVKKAYDHAWNKGLVIGTFIGYLIQFLIHNYGR